jgi:hypothetical protein
MPHRDHPAVKIFTFGSDDMNLMCYGTVGYKSADETVNMKEWAGRYEIVRTNSGTLKFKYAQVIIVSLLSAEQQLTRRTSLEATDKCFDRAPRKKLEAIELGIHYGRMVETVKLAC